MRSSRSCVPWASNRPRPQKRRPKANPPSPGTNSSTQTATRRVSMLPRLASAHGHKTDTSETTRATSRDASARTHSFRFGGNGKAGVDGSSPSEGFDYCLLSRLFRCRVRRCARCRASTGRPRTSTAGGSSSSRRRMAWSPLSRARWPWWRSIMVRLAPSARSPLDHQVCSLPAGVLQGVGRAGRNTSRKSVTISALLQRRNSPDEAFDWRGLVQRIHPSS
jgi:hypothetical protein